MEATEGQRREADAQNHAVRRGDSYEAMIMRLALRIHALEEKVAWLVRQVPNP